MNDLANLGKEEDIPDSMGMIGSKDNSFNLLNASPSRANDLPNLKLNRASSSIIKPKK